MRILLVTFISASLTFFGCKSGKKLAKKKDKIEKIDAFAFDFISSNKLAYVLELAQKEDKLIFIDLYTTWCLPCKMMDQNVFTHYLY